MSQQETSLVESLVQKWEGVLESEVLPEIKDPYRKAVTAILLENEEKALQEAAPTNVAAGVAGYDPVLIGMVRRAMPHLMAYDVVGVQPMTTPTGLVFAMRSRYTNQSGNEALFNEADSGFAGVSGSAFGSTVPVAQYATTASAAGTVTVSSADATAIAALIGSNTAVPVYNVTQGVYGEIANAAAINTGTGVITLSNTSATWANVSTGGVQLSLGTGAGMTTAAGEGDISAKMGFSIEKVSVEAKTWQLATGYSVELAQDMRALHGMDADAELSNILSMELVAETNRRLLRTLYNIAKPGAMKNTAVKGTFNLTADADGRWSVERFKGLLFAIERDANAIATDVRLGKGNYVIVSADVASALAAAGILDYAPAIASLEALNADFTQNTFVGVMNGRMKVYVDPYATGDFYFVGYKGASQYQAGYFYTPYVPAQLLRATDPASFQPLLAMKVRAGEVANPLNGSSSTNNGAKFRQNGYYRVAQVTNLI